jgi:hypothetical protein
MSLTRAEWLDMWCSVKKLERLSNELLENKSVNNLRRGTIIRTEVNKMKEQIQSVVGQLE